MFKVLCSRKLTVTLLELEQYLQGIVAISKATNVQQLQTLYAHGYWLCSLISTWISWIHLMLMDIYSANGYSYGQYLLPCPTDTNTLCSWKSIIERKLYAWCASNHVKMSLIMCYALANDTIKDELYDNFWSVIDSVLLRNIICIAGDLKLKVGYERFYCSEVIGHHRLGTINENCY